MRDNDDAEMTVEESIQLRLCGIEAVIDTVGEEPDFVDVRDRLTRLLEQLRNKHVHPEYAEIELHKIDDQTDQWLRDNPISPDDESCN